MWNTFTIATFMPAQKSFGLFYEKEFGYSTQDSWYCLNSRPIALASDDPNDLNALTPAHLLIGSFRRENGQMVTGDLPQTTVLVTLTFTIFYNAENGSSATLAVSTSCVRNCRTRWKGSRCGNERHSKEFSRDWCIVQYLFRKIFATETQIKEKENC